MDSSQEHMLRIAAAALTHAAGGTLVITAGDIAKMPDGELHQGFSGEDLELTYDARAKPEHMDRIGGEIVATPEMHNNQLIHLCLAVTTINAGYTLRLSGEHLGPVLAMDADLAIGMNDAGGIEFTLVEAA